MTVFRPKLALPFTVLAEPGRVRLVAGEDHRYTLESPGLDAWLPGLLARMDGRTVDSLVEGLTPEAVAQAKEMISRLRSERVLVEATAAEAHVARRYWPVAEGAPELVTRLSGGEGAPLRVFCQDRLDYDAALRVNRERVPWLWVSAAPMTRGYVGPVFLPDAGPCFACLLDGFRRLTPEPELFEALMTHSGAIEPTPMGAVALDALAAIARWKIERMADSMPPSAVYRLHVLEAATMEVTTHRVIRNPECPECGR